ncbi:MAG: MarR family EPS-associated transcriptional regulator [Pseudomonadota bacterium]
MLSVLDDETRYRLLSLLHEYPDLNQRDIARELGVSVGKANYCLRALTSKGWVKASNFRRSENKKGYAYLITPKGLEEKARATMNFLRRKIAEYEAIKEEIQRLKGEVASSGVPNRE